MAMVGDHLGTRTRIWDLMMKTYGNPETKELISLIETAVEGHVGIGYHVEQLCPPAKYWASHPRAPWNAPEPERDPDWWRAEYPDAWAAVEDEDPVAPWNAPGPDRDPANHVSADGTALLWTAPEVVPLVKLDPPALAPGEECEPILAWHDDRVERGWSIVPLLPEQIAAASRKVWPTVAEFWAEFEGAEKYAIEVSTDPEIIVLRADLKLWLRDVWSDDPRIIYALEKLVTVGILTEERRAAILQKA